MGTAVLHPQPSSFKQDTCKCSCSTAWVCAYHRSTMAYRVQLLHILPASNAMNLAFHLEEHLQRNSWWHSPVSSGKVRGIFESEVEGFSYSVLAVSKLRVTSLVLSLCRHPLRPQREQPQPQTPFFLSEHHGYRVVRHHSDRRCTQTVNS